MAGFTTHVTVSSLLGIGYGTAGYFSGMPLTTCGIAAGLCAVSGMFPDMDGDTGVPVKETIALIAAVIPALLLSLFDEWGLGREMTALLVIGLYVVIRFGAGSLFKNLTKHRGMWHSIPAAINVGMIAFLLCSGDDVYQRFFKGGAVIVGFVSHLLLDEIYSFDPARMRVKSSFGSAFKLWIPRRWWPNVLTYGILILLFAAIIKDPMVRGYVGDKMATWRGGEAASSETARGEFPVSEPKKLGVGAKAAE